MAKPKKEEDQFQWKEIAETISDDLFGYFSGNSPTRKTGPSQRPMTDNTTENDGDALLPDVDDSLDNDLDRNLEASEEVQSHELSEMNRGEAEEASEVSRRDSREPAADQPDSKTTSRVQSKSTERAESGSTEQTSPTDNWAILASDLGVTSDNPSSSGQSPKAVRQPTPLKRGDEQKVTNKRAEKARSIEAAPPKTPFGGFLGADFEEPESQIQDPTAEVLSDLFHPTIPPEPVSRSRKVIDDTLDPIEAEFDDDFDDEIDEDVDLLIDDEEALDELDLEIDAADFVEYEIEDLYSETGDALPARERRPQRGQREARKPREAREPRERSAKTQTEPRSRSPKRNLSTPERSSDERNIDERSDEEGVDIDSTSDKLESKQGRKPRRKKRRVKKGREEHPISNEIREKADVVDVRDDGEELDDHDDLEDMESSRASGKVHRFPTWSEAVGLIVDTNMSQRKKSRPARKRRERD